MHMQSEVDEMECILDRVRWEPEPAASGAAIEMLEESEGCAKMNRVRAVERERVIVLFSYAVPVYCLIHPMT
jgi:hypothetical protein